MSMLPESEGHSRIPWIAIAFAILAVVSFLNIAGGAQSWIMPMVGISAPSYDYDYDYGGYPEGSPIMPRGVMMDKSSTVSSGEYGVDYYPYPGRGGASSITDTREFMKVNYNADIRTRRVQELTTQVEGIVAKADGRVDSMQSAREYAYISFVVSKAEFASVRAELESLVDSRFIEVNISSENLLPEKQSIEEQKKYVQEYLDEAKTDRAAFVAEHQRTVSSLQSELDAVAREIASLNAEVTSDPVRQAQIALRLQSLYAQQTSLRSRLANENSSYAEDLPYYDDNITSLEKSLENVEENDQDLLDDVGTVSGSVSLRWISYWEMAKIYLPGYWIPAIFALLSVLSYAAHRRRIWIF